MLYLILNETIELLIHRTHSGWNLNFRKKNNILSVLVFSRKFKLCPGMELHIAVFHLLLQELCVTLRR